jgi:transposase
VTFDEVLARYQEIAARLDAMDARMTRAEHERDEYKKLYELVSLELERTRRHIFGKKSEAVDPAQTQLVFQAAVPPAVLPAPGAKNRRGKNTSDGPAKPHGRKKPPEHLPVERIELTPPEVELEPAAYERIGEETRELIEWRAASHVRVIVVRSKYVRKGDPTRGVLIADPLPLPIERGLAGPGLLAWVIVSKFCDHLPLHRLQGILDRYGVPIARSTLAGWVEAMHGLCAPVVQAAWDDAMKSSYIAVDATGVLVQAPEQCRRGHFWVLASDNGHVLFRYTKRANKQNVRELLGGYQGYLQADAATVFDFLYLDQTCVEVGCWAHCRRRYFDALTTDSERANTALGLIAQLYLIDRESIDMPLEVRTRERAARAGPVLDALLAWVDQQALEVLPESPIGKAVTYTRNQRVALSRFLGDGRLRLDNNRSERELRREAVGRKNWLFVGSDEGAKWNATFVSLIASCQQHKLEPWAYLRDLFCLVPDWPQTRLLELTPKHWRQTLQQPHAQQQLAANRLRAISFAQSSHTEQPTQKPG